MFLSLVIGRINYYLRCNYSKNNNNLKKTPYFFILIHKNLTNTLILTTDQWVFVIVTLFL
jgi:hypothetical protein